MRGGKSIQGQPGHEESLAKPGTKRKAAKYHQLATTQLITHKSNQHVPGITDIGQGMVRKDMERQDTAEQSKAWQGMTWHSKAVYGNARHGRTRQSMVRQSMVRQGKARKNIGHDTVR